jgi:hypothetical protein
MSRKMKPYILAVSLLLITPLLSAQSPAPAGNGQALDQSAVTLRQEVRNVILDVVVTDKHGHPITSTEFPITAQALKPGVALSSPPAAVHPSRSAKSKAGAFIPTGMNAPAFSIHLRRTHRVIRTMR